MKYTGLPKIFFDHQTSNGDSDTILLLTGNAEGKKQLQVSGVFGGATVTVLTANEIDPINFKLLANGTIATPSDITLDPLKTGTLFKLNIAGATGTTDITAVLR